MPEADTLRRRYRCRYTKQKKIIGERGRLICYDILKFEVEKKPELFLFITDGGY